MRVCFVWFYNNNTSRQTLKLKDNGHRIRFIFILHDMPMNRSSFSDTGAHVE